MQLLPHSPAPFPSSADRSHCALTAFYRILFRCFWRLLDFKRCWKIPAALSSHPCATCSVLKSDFCEVESFCTVSMLLGLSFHDLIFFCARPAGSLYIFFFPPQGDFRVVVIRFNDFAPVGVVGFGSGETPTPSTSMLRSLYSDHHSHDSSDAVRRNTATQYTRVCSSFSYFFQTLDNSD